MRIVLVTGTVGVGKSTTGYAVAERAASQGRSAAFLDVDELSRLWPARAADPFNTDLILRNLASLVGNYADAGAELLVLAWVVQDTDALVRLEEAVGASVVAIRLCASASTLEARLRQRHHGAEFDGLAWHLDRAPELVAIQDRGLQLPIIDASGSISETVDAVLGTIG
ncbi:MAG TPA: AAA family ATPase [Ilumatobacteraceae bacterium]|nr:AAA family ATPase [Ilumatobacteraceae bacterium]